MPFPLTINGNTYSRADFEPHAYARNLGKILFDLESIKVNDYLGFSGTSVAAVSGTIVDFTLASGGGALVPGVRVSLFSPVPAQGVGGELIEVQVYGVVTARVSDVLSVMVEGAFESTSAHSPWFIGYSGLRDGTWAPAASTEAEVRRVSGVPDAPTNPFLVEDFERYRAPAFTGNDGPRTGIITSCSGTARIDFNVLKSGASSAPTSALAGYRPGGTRADDSVPDLGNHPGWARMSVRGVSDTCAICFQDTGTLSFGAGLEGTFGQTFQACFYMPLNNSPEDTDKFQLVLGLKNNVGAVAGNRIDLASPEWGTIFQNELTPRYPDSAGRLSWGIDGTRTSVSEADPGNPPGGVWYRLTFYSGDVGNKVPFVRMESLDPARPYVKSKAFLEKITTGPDKDTASTPFVKLVKTAGGNERVIYVDSISLGAQRGEQPWR